MVVAATAVVQSGFSISNFAGTIAAIFVVLGIVLPVVARWVKHNLEEAITKVVSREIGAQVKSIMIKLENHETRLVRLEGYNRGRQDAYNERQEQERNR